MYCLCMPSLIRIYVLYGCLYGVCRDVLHGTHEQSRHDIGYHSFRALSHPRAHIHTHVARVGHARRARQPLTYIVVL